MPLTVHPQAINASCDLNTTTSNLFVGSNPESLELNINANVKGSSYQSVLIDITSILGTNAINVAVESPFRQLVIKIVEDLNYLTFNNKQLTP